MRGACRLDLALFARLLFRGARAAGRALHVAGVSRCAHLLGVAFGCAGAAVLRNVSTAFRIVSQSDLLPMIIATKGFDSGMRTL